MDFLYRYDPYVPHMRLHGDMLRARRWRSAEPGTCQHVPLLAAEAQLKTGDGIFRISFWKNLDAALSWMSPTLWVELHVLQRVRADHPFFREFQRLDDDYLPSTAWLFWNAMPCNSAEEWSRQGIAKADIEVLDLDGEWRALPDSTIMAESSVRFQQCGYKPHFFMRHGRPAVAYWSTRLFLQAAGDPAVAVLIHHPYESEVRIQNERAAIQAVVDHVCRDHAPAVAAEHFRLFIVDEARRTFEDKYMVEIPLIARMREDTDPRPGWRSLLARPRRAEPYQILVMPDGWRWYGYQDELCARIVSAFGLLTQRAQLAQYQALLKVIHSGSDLREGTSAHLDS